MCIKLIKLLQSWPSALCSSGINFACTEFAVLRHLAWFSWVALLQCKSLQSLHLAESSHYASWSKRLTIPLANSTTPIGGRSPIACSLGILVGIGLVHVSRVNSNIGRILPCVSNNGTRVVVALLQLAACNRSMVYSHINGRCGQHMKKNDLGKV